MWNILSSRHYLYSAFQRIDAFYTPLQSVSNSNTTSRERAHPPSLFLSLFLSISRTLSWGKKKEKKDQSNEAKDCNRQEKNFVVVVFSFFFPPRHERNVASKRFSSIIRPGSQFRKCRYERKIKIVQRRTGTRVGILEPVLSPYEDTKEIDPVTPCSAPIAAPISGRSICVACAHQIRIHFFERDSKQRFEEFAVLLLTPLKYLNHVPYISFM